jgi:hypothetical protein
MNQEKGNTIGVTVLQERPWKELCARNVVPGAAGRRGWAKFRRTSPGFGRGRAGDGPRGAKGLILGAAGGEERPGNGGRRRGAGSCHCGRRSGEDAGLARQFGVREAAVEDCGGECAHELAVRWLGGGVHRGGHGAVAARCSGRRGRGHGAAVK